MILLILTSVQIATQDWFANLGSNFAAAISEFDFDIACTACEFFLFQLRALELFFDHDSPAISRDIIRSGLKLLTSTAVIVMHVTLSMTLAFIFYAVDIYSALVSLLL